MEGEDGSYLKEKMLSNFKTTLSWVLAAATLVSAIPVGAQVFQAYKLTLMEQILSSLIIVLTLGVLFEFLTIRDLKRELSKIKNEAKGQVDQFKDLINKKFYGIAFATFLEEPPEEYDDTHYITCLKSEIDITEDGMIFQETFKGRNASNKESTHLTVRIDGDSPLTIDDTDFKMYYLSEEDQWEFTDNWEAEKIGKYSIRFHMYFREPLEPDESFALRYESATGEWPTKGEEYIEIPQHRFTRGTEHAQAIFEFDDEPEKVVVQKVKNDMPTSYFRNAERVNFEMETLESTIFNKGGSWFTKLEDHNANALYIFKLSFSS